MNTPPYVAEFTKDCAIGKNKEFRFKTGDITLMPGYMCKELIEKQLAEIYSARDIFKDFHPGMKGLLFVQLIWGIGDIVAFSAVASYLKDYFIIGYAHPRHFGLIDHYASRNVTQRRYLTPVTSGRHGTDSLLRLNLEYAAIEAGPKNWYKAFFERIGAGHPGSEYYRPQMINIAPIQKDTVLICHRSSCQIRSSRFEDFYWPVKSVHPGKMILVYDADLTEDDRKFIERETLDVEILKQGTVDDYMKTLCEMELVVSTDTSAIHYREGVKKPALAAFGAMTVESRTQYYQYTKSFNVKSTCERQPCFAHELTKGAMCWLGEKMNTEQTAPCIVGESFQEQLRMELLNYKY